MINKFLLFFVTSLTMCYQDCIIENIFRNLNIQAETKRKIIDYKKMSDFDSNPSFEQPLHKLLEIKDFKSNSNLEQLLMNFKILDPVIKKSILECNLPKENVLKRCKKLFKDCIQVDEFTYAKNCEKGFVSVGHVYCVPLCPPGFDSIANDPFFCTKGAFSQRSSEFKNTYLDKKNYRGVFEVNVCPQGFQEIDNDICLRNCPKGWEDFGHNCRKPVVERRKNQVFFYQFDYDNVYEE
jgi:hypothetical protein